MNYFQEAFKKYDDLNESVQENVSAIRVVKAYVRGDYEKRVSRKQARTSTTCFSVQSPLSYGTRH